MVEKQKFDSLVNARIKDYFANNSQAKSRLLNELPYSREYASKIICGITPVSYGLLKTFVDYLDMDIDQILLGHEGYCNKSLKLLIDFESGRNKGDEEKIFKAYHRMRLIVELITMQLSYDKNLNDGKKAKIIECGEICDIKYESFLLDKITAEIYRKIHGIEKRNFVKNSSAITQSGQDAMLMRLHMMKNQLRNIEQNRAKPTPYTMVDTYEAYNISPMFQLTGNIAYLRDMGEAYDSLLKDKMDRFESML